MSDQPKPMLPGLPTLPQPLVDAIGEYGLARTDGVSEIERVHRWEVLISLVKDYAGAIQLATWKAAMEYAAGLCEQNAVETPLRGKKRLASADAHFASESIHDGMIYAAAIRQAPEPGEGG